MDKRERIIGWLKENLVKLLVIGFLLGILGNPPYSYYQILKWIILGAGFYFALRAYDKGDKVFTWIFGIIALLFNPIIPFYFSKNTWQFIDIFVAIIFFISIFYKYKK